MMYDFNNFKITRVMNTRNLILSFGAALVASSTYGQSAYYLPDLLAFEPENKIEQPVNLSEGNFKGNVLGVVFVTCQYKENFGEPTEGDVYERIATFYDETGNSFLRRKLNQSDYACTYFYDKNASDGGLLVTAFGVGGNIGGPNLQDGIEAMSKLDGSFENAIKNVYVTKHDIYEGLYDKNGVRIKLDLFGSGKKLKSREIGKLTGNNTYEFDLYNNWGESIEKSTRTFSNGRLLKKTSPQFVSVRADIISPKNGTYTYDKAGRIIHYIKPNNQEEEKYFYNPKGDLTHTSSKKYTGWVDRNFYENYKYDSHGNWVYRTFAREKGKPVRIEKRTIIYCDSKEEIKQKTIDLIKTAGELVKNIEGSN